MFQKLYSLLFGDHTERILKTYEKDLARVLELEQKLQDELRTVEDIQNKTQHFRRLFTDLDPKNEEDFARIQAILHDIRHEAFAVHKIACQLIL